MCNTAPTVKVGEQMFFKVTKGTASQKSGITRRTGQDTQESRVETLLVYSGSLAVILLNVCYSFPATDPLFTKRLTDPYRTARRRRTGSRGAGLVGPSSRESAAGSCTRRGGRRRCCAPRWKRPRSRSRRTPSSCRTGSTGCCQQTNE